MPSDPNARRTIARLLAGAALAAAALPAAAQDQPGGGPQPGQPGAPQPGQDERTVTINPNPQGGWSVLDLFAYIQKATGRSILYDETSNQKLKQAKITFVGSHVVRESELFDWLQAVLSFNNMVLVPVGPVSPDGSQQWFCLDQNNPAIKTKPVYVAEDDIPKYQDRDGLYIVTSISLKNISDTGRVRQALTALTTQTASIGRIQDVPGSRAIIIGDFAPVVAAMKRLVDYIDVDNPKIEPAMEVVELQHAVASELGPIISDLIESADQQQRQRPQPGQADEEPQPKIIPDDRLDALIIYATERYMTKIQDLIRKLDVPTRARGRLHFKALKHSDAQDMASLLEDLIEGAGRSSTSGGRTTSTTRRTTRPTNVPTPGTPGATAFGGSEAEGRPVIIADPKSNSLIIHASPTQYDSIVELIEQLDTSRPQVLIETALVELAVSEQLDLGVELFHSQSNIAVDTNNDGTPDTITQDTKGAFGSAFGITDLVTTEVNGVKVPVNRTLGDALAEGFTAGIFSRGKLALALTAVQSSGRAKILTRPSIVANDNEKASILLTRETSYKQTVRDNQNSSTDSFQPVTADTELTISPHISSESFLRLEIEQKVANFGTRPSPGAPPDKTERTISTNVTIPDAYTVVLGGLIQEEQRNTVSKVPLLGDIPLLGFFFRKTSDISSPQQLFLFVTPRILRDMNGFKEFHQVTWERKLLQDEVFRKEVELGGTQFKGPGAGEPATPAERMDAIEKSGALDGVKLKAPPTQEDLQRRAEEEYRRNRAAAPLPGSPPPPPRPADAPRDAPLPPGDAK